MARWTSALMILVVFDLLFALFGLTSSSNSPSSCLLNYALDITNTTGCSFYGSIFALIGGVGAIILIGTFITNSPDTTLRITGLLGIFLPMVIDFGIAFNTMKEDLAGLIGTTPALFLSALIVSPIIIAMYMALTDWIFGKD